MPLVLASLVFGYLLGSIPFGLLLTRAAGLGDVRSIGSGNIGATNVLRTGNKGLAATTLLLDMLKGTAAVALANWFVGFEAALAAGFGAFVGHIYPVWLRFKGGKGVATYIGVLLGFGWIPAAIFAVIWLIVAAIWRYSSLAALVALSLTPICIFLFDRGNPAAIMLALMLALMSLIAIFKHRANIERLRAGTESRIGSKG